MTRPIFADISVSAFQHNLQRVKQFAANSQVIAMVKANGYGHGLAEMVSALTEADRFGVCSLEEAMAVRAISSKDVMLMEGFFAEEELATIAQHDFILVIHSLAQIDILEKGSHSLQFRVYLKINTGMNRLGVAPDEVKTAIQRLTNCAAVKKLIGVMTHCANADVCDDPTTSDQIKLFHQLIQDFSGEISIGNSAVIIAWPDANSAWVRPGLMLYGISPFANTSGIDYGLKPAMTLRSEIIALRHCHGGDKIGYGGAYVCEKPMLIGVVAIGYGDGYPRHAPTGTPVLVGSKIVPLLGRVSMDMITVDCSPITDVHVGTPVILWGEGLPIERIAEMAGTIPYELVCGVTLRVPKRYIDR